MATSKTGQNDLSVDVTEPFQRQGSIRKVVPPLPSADSQLSVSAKMIDRPAISNRGHQKAYSTFHQEYSLISEFNMFGKQELPGIYVIPSAKSSLLWFGVFFVRQGVYQGGIFRFCIHIPEAFPDGGCPRVVFQSKVFHPMINYSTGEMDVRSGFEEWRKNVNHIWQVVQYVRRAFYKIETESPLNQEASELYDKNQETFCDRAKQCVKDSQQQIYDHAPTDDRHYIIFEPYEEEVHGPIRNTIFKIKENEDALRSTGLSWVQPGSLQPFSKPTS